MIDLNSLQSPIKIGQGSNKTKFDTTGFMSAEGEARAFRDEYPSFAWLPAGAQASPGLENHAIGGVNRRVYCFNGITTEETLSNSFEVPHDYMYGEVIEVHAHFRPTDNNAGDIKFFFDWEHSPAMSAPAAQTTLSLIQTVNTQQYYQFIAAFGNLPALGFQLGDKIGFNIRRTPSDVEDTYGSDVILEQVALHIPVDTNGSRELYVK